MGNYVPSHTHTYKATHCQQLTDSGVLKAGSRLLTLHVIYALKRLSPRTQMDQTLPETLQLFPFPILIHFLPYKFS